MRPPNAMPSTSSSSGEPGPDRVMVVEWSLSSRSMAPSMADWMSQATLCSGRTSSRRTMPPCAGDTPAGGANSVVAMRASSAASTRTSDSAGRPRRVGGVGLPAGGDALAAGPAHQDGHRDPGHQRGGGGRARRGQQAGAGVVGRRGRLGQRGRCGAAAPRPSPPATLPGPWAPCRPAPSRGRGRPPGSRSRGCRWAVPITHLASVSSNGASRWTSAFSMSTGHWLPIVSQSTSVSRTTPGSG